jgi:hypothetical protein
VSEAIPKPSRKAKVDLTWADGEYTFRLPIARLEELQEKCNAGPATIFQRICSGAWYVNDIRETIRLGLIGGGMPATKALSMVQRYVDDQPLGENVPVAQAILLAVIVGVPDEPVGKAPAAESPEATAESPSPPYTDSAQQSDSPPPK